MMRLRAVHQLGRAVSTGRRCFSSGGHIYSWGTGDDGQLGHQSIVKSGLTNTYVELSPSKIETFPEGKRFIDISTGFTHAAAVTDGGELYTWGNAEYGKLGHDSLTEDAQKAGHKICMVPARVEMEEPIKQVVCGGIHIYFTDQC